MPDPAPVTLEDFRAQRDVVRALPIFGRVDLSRIRRNIDDAFDDFGNGGGGGGTSKSPLDEEQGASHPFAISVEIATLAGNGDWATADVSVLSGTYKTDGGTAYNANDVAFPGIAKQEVVSRAGDGSFAGYVYIYIPLVADNSSTGVPTANTPSKVRAVEGGEIRFRTTPAVEWPTVVRVEGGAATAVRIGTWNINRVNIAPSGVPTYKLRVTTDNVVKDNIVLGVPTEAGEAQSPAAMPWQIFQASDTTAEIKQALLLSSTASNTYVTVTGLTGLALGTDTTYWLSGTFDGTGTPTGWAVTTTPPAGSLMTFDSDGIQTGAWYPLARVVSGSQPQLSGYDFVLDGDTYHLEQLCMTRLAVKAVCGGGIGGFYPVPQ